ncbi:3-oxoacyl-[acyl-carrier-protein] synthase III C-terminal domain-containing protein [Aerosakkonema sp. BLCC-F183]|uniref:3-oxoacyl-[acyl-carrier-protein] synthase III C-terminal domain-containing protein n=1 Tax=Aerosakkonema sp. BLCC-F183 TaxID=3342834 RepID=UPI0035B8A9A5
MNNQTDTVGIAAIGYYIPSRVLTSEEIAQLSNFPVSVFIEKIGMHQKHIAEVDEHPSDMGVKAALNAIEQAKILPQEINFIAFCGAGHYDYSFWSPAAKVQDKIGATNAFAFEVRNFCNGGNLGLHICSNMLLANPDAHYALVVCSDKLSVLLNYADKDCLSTFIMADGAAAAVLKKGETTNQILAYHGITNGKLADYVKVEGGGTKFFDCKDEYDRNLNYLTVKHPKTLEKIFSEIYLNNYLEVIKTALHKSGYSSKDINFIFTNQVKKKVSNSILQSLGLTEKNTFVSLSEYGHMGAADTLFGLAKTLEQNLVKSGNIVVLANSATGFSWAAIVLKY